MPRLNPLLDELAPYPMAELLGLRRRLEGTGMPVYDFGLGDPVDPTPAFIQEAIRGAIDHRSSYPTVHGSRGVREAIASYIERRFNVRLDPDTSILPTSGSKEVLFHLPMAAVDPSASDRGVVFPDPGYPSYHRGAVFAGGEPIPVALDGDWVLRPWDLPDEIIHRTRLIYLNTPHNPSGAVTSLEDLARIHQFCMERDILLVSDECYADIYYKAPPPSLLQVSDRGALVVHTLSKRSGMTGYRSGFLAGDPNLIARLAAFRTMPGVAPSDFVNEAARVAWLDDAHVDERRANFARRRAVLLDFLEEAGLEVMPSSTTFYVWFRAPVGFDDLSYARHLLKAGIVVTPGRWLACSRSGDGWVRLALVPELDDCRAATEAWRALL